MNSVAMEFFLYAAVVVGVLGAAGAARRRR